MNKSDDELPQEQVSGSKTKSNRPITRILAPFNEAMAIFRLSSGTYNLRRYWTWGQVAELDLAVERLQKAADQSPPGSTYRPAFLFTLGIALGERYKRSGDPADLNKAIQLYEEAVKLAPPGSPNRPPALNNLGMGMHERYRRSGDPADLERAITAYEEAVEQIPAGSPEKPSILNNLGIELRIRYILIGNPTDLERAIQAHEEALQHAPARSPSQIALLNRLDRPAILNNLGDDLRAQHARSGNVGELERAIQVYDEAVRLTPPGSPIRPMYVGNLGAALRVSYTDSGKLQDLERAIQVLDEAVHQTPVDSPIRAVYLNSLGAALDLRYNSNGDRTDLERAIQVYDEAVQLTPSSSPDLPGWLASLGAGLSMHYLYSGNPADLERAIQMLDEAVQKSPPDSANRLSCLNNLGAVLRTRYNRTGDLADLERAIKFFDEAVQKSSPGSPLLPACLGNLGASLRVRYTRNQDIADLNRALQAYRDALMELPPTSPSLPTHLNNLANGLNERYEYGGEPADLDSAIQVWEEAVKQSRPGSPILPVCLINLGAALRERYTRSGNLPDLERAIQVHEQSLEQTTPGSPNRVSCFNSLANDLSERYTHSGNPADLERAVAAYEDACRDGLQVDVESALMAAQNWGNWAQTRKAWTEASRAYTYGLDASDQLFRVQLLRASKESWLRAARNLHACAAYAFAQTADLPRAVEALEHGHARLLSRTLERDRAALGQLQMLAPNVHEQYVAAANRVQALEAQDVGSEMFFSPDLAENAHRPMQPPGQVLADTIRQAYADLDAAVKAVRQIPGYAEFLMPSTFVQIRQSVGDALLVYLTITRSGGLALIVYPPKESNQSETVAITPLWLDELTEQALNEKLLKLDNTTVGGYLGSYLLWKANRKNRIAWLIALDQTTRWLWDVLMGPLTQTLTNQGVTHAILIPQSLLALLPLHAAWTEDTTTPSGRRYALDDVTFSYAPNARALATVRTIAASIVPDALLTVEDPQPITVADSLPNTAQEVEAAASHFDRNIVLHGEAATHEALMTILSEEALQQEPMATALTNPQFSPVWHFSCHGQAHPAEPLESGILLAQDRWLTLRELLTLRLPGARLAILSACETAIPGTQLPDEVIGLPTGLTQAGVAGIIASLWSVSDLSTTLLLVRFYDLWKGEHMEPIEALRKAQIWLRDTPNGEKANYFKRALPEFQEIVPAELSYKLPLDVANALYQDLMRRRPDLRDFAHPYFWAAFGFTGV